MNEFSDDNWSFLKKSVKSGNIIPVIGPDALVIALKDKPDSQPTPFYRLVAADLLHKFQLEPQPEILDHTWALHKAVFAILASKRGEYNQVRRAISSLVDNYSERVTPAESLRTLVSIKAFNKFVSLTPDEILKNAMIDSDGSERVLCSSFSPLDSSETISDLPPLRQGERGVFQLLGSCMAIGSGFAIHEEDALEYLYRLQTDAARRFANILSELRRRDILFIGCNFPDWLGRAMLRLVNDNRLYAQEKTQEFLCPGVSDDSLNSFLTQYSPHTLGFEGPPEELITKLANIFGSSTTPQPKPISSPPSRCGPTVFVSYASENAEAARRLADTLLKLGFSDVWLDKKKLIGGDDWSDRIDEAITKCDFFVPLLSMEADNRREGVFWDEWKTAIERARRIKDAYLLPVGIDPEPPSKSRYRRISEGITAEFFDKHLIHAPNGLLTTEDNEALIERSRRFMEDYHD